MSTTKEDPSAPMVKLYWLDNSRSQRILWLLHELKIPYELQIFHRDAETMMAPPELAKIHPLGKSPVISVTPAAGPGEAKQEPIVIAESGFMTDYLCEHFPEGKRLVPSKWKAGKEGTVGGETEAWMRYQYYLHYCEGSFMSTLVMALIIGRLRSPSVPFYIRPITASVANRIFTAFIFPNAHKHIALIDSHLASAPDGGPYLCGKTLSAADILLSFPLIAGESRFDDMGAWEGGSWKTEFPRVWSYVQMLEAEEGYKESVRKIEEIEGKKFSPAL